MLTIGMFLVLVDFHHPTPSLYTYLYSWRDGGSIVQRRIQNEGHFYGQW